MSNVAKVLPSNDVIAELAPTGVLRVGVNLINFLLVTGKTASGDPVGVSPDMGAELANRLGVPVKYVNFKNPAMLVDESGNNVWDVALVGDEPQRAQVITFTPAYCEIEATYLVPKGSLLETIDDVDKAGVRIAVAERTAYDLWLDRNLKYATLKRSVSFETAFNEFIDDKLEALAGLRSGLVKDAAKLPGSRLLNGRFMTVQQAIGTPKKNTLAPAYLRAFVEETKASGFVQSLITRHNVPALSVAPAG
jgi:polar amino acid transport system substrate-binding protein